MQWLVCLAAVLSSCFLSAQTSDSQITPAPEMARLAQALAGNWKNVETMEVSEQFPTLPAFDNSLRHRLLSA